MTRKYAGSCSNGDPRKINPAGIFTPCIARKCSAGIGYFIIYGFARRSISAIKRYPSNIWTICITRDTFFSKNILCLNHKKTQYEYI